MVSLSLGNILGQDVQRSRSVRQDQILTRAFGTPRRPSLGAVLVTVRIEPSTFPELEFRIEFRKAEPAIVEYEAAGRHFNDVWFNTSPDDRDIDRLASQMSVKKETLTIPFQEADAWLTAFQSASKATISAVAEGSRTVQLDGALYTVTTTGGVSRLTLQMGGPDVVSKDDVSSIPLVKWASEVRLKIEAHLKHSQ
jgi:hypothetical protein